MRTLEMSLLHVPDAIPCLTMYRTSVILYSISVSVNLDPGTYISNHRLNHKLTLRSLRAQLCIWTGNTLVPLSQCSMLGAF